MALHSKKDFAETVGLKTNALAVYIKRKKIILSGDYIDDSLATNRDFIEKRARVLLKNEVKGRPATREPQAPNVKPPQTPKPPVPNVEEAEEEGGSLFQKIERLKAAKLREEIELLKIKKHKLNAELIPTELVKPLFMQFSKSLTTAYQNELDSMLMEIAHKTKLSNKDRAYFKKRVIEVINQSNKEGVEDTKKNIKHIADQYAEVRGRGESK